MFHCAVGWMWAAVGRKCALCGQEYGSGAQWHVRAFYHFHKTSHFFWKKISSEVEYTFLSSHRPSLEEYKIHQSHFLNFIVSKNKAPFSSSITPFFFTMKQYILNVKLFFTWIFTDAVLRVTVYSSKFSSCAISSKSSIYLCIYVYWFLSWQDQ